MSTLRKRGTAGANGCAEYASDIPGREEWKSRASKVIRLLDRWAGDDSGYDEQTLPALKKSLNGNRLSSRRLFHGKA